MTDKIKIDPDTAITGAVGTLSVSTTYDLPVLLENMNGGQRSVGMLINDQLRQDKNITQIVLNLKPKTTV